MTAVGDEGEAEVPPGDEAVEVVDDQGEVVEVVRRAEMRTRRLRHRCTYVAVVDSAGSLVVHQRAAWKDVWPSRWDVAFGGVARVGEAWDLAAARELREEAGVEADLVELGGRAYDDDTVSLLGRIYLAVHDGPFSFPDGEVVAVDRVSPGEADGWLSTHATCPDSVALVLPALRASGRWAARR